jgi:iron complex transport system ATP-binding protein
MPQSRRVAGNHPLELDRVRLVRDDRAILDSVTWTVEQDQRWLVLGANGSGKTTLLRIASLYLHPSSGEVRVLGETLGQTDVRLLRRRIGIASAAMAAELRPELSATDIVMTAKYAALEPWWHQYTDDDRAKARECLARFQVDQFAERPIGTLSSGEQQRVLLARSIMTDPGIVLLDEPSARLDLGGREQLVQALGGMALDPSAPPLALITHHVDEVPPGITHALLLREGKVLASGPIEETVTAASISECFGMSLALERRPNGRFSAWATST